MHRLGLIIEDTSFLPLLNRLHVDVKGAPLNFKRKILVAVYPALEARSDNWRLLALKTAPATARLTAMPATIA